MQNNLLIYLFPFIGALIGWFTNYLAVRMLFRPHKPVDFKLFVLQGLIPKRRKEVAANIASTIEKDILSVKDISGVLDDINWQEGLENKIYQLLRQRAQDSVLSKLPFWDGIRKNILPKIEAPIAQEVIKLVEGLQKTVVDNFQHKLDLHNLVFNRINHFDTQKLEDVVLKIARQELRHIELLGAVLGFVIGMIQVLLMLLVQG